MCINATQFSESLSRASWSGERGLVDRGGVDAADGAGGGGDDGWFGVVFQASQHRQAFGGAGADFTEGGGGGGADLRGGVIEGAG